MLSEAVKPAPAPSVIAWLRAHQSTELSISVLTFGEIEKGIESLGEGRRRSELERWARVELPRRFFGRIHPVDVEVARNWGLLMSEGRRIGRPLPIIDGLLLATARAHNLTLVTRNEVDCAGRGVSVVNPWSAEVSR